MIGCLALSQRSAAFAGLLCITVTVALGGCTGGSDRATVSGKVLLDGTPLTTGRILAENSAGKTVEGDIQSDGTFLLKDRDKGLGVPPGAYQVSVTAYEGFASIEDPEAELKSLIPLKYSEPGTSGLAFEVAAKESKELTLALSTSD